MPCNGNIMQHNVGKTSVGVLEVHRHKSCKFYVVKSPLHQLQNSRNTLKLERKMLCGKTHSHIGQPFSAADADEIEKQFSE